jgi:hypothetical protein
MEFGRATGGRSALTLAALKASERTENPMNLLTTAFSREFQMKLSMYERVTSFATRENTFDPETSPRPCYERLDQLVVSDVNMLPFSF